MLKIKNYHYFILIFLSATCYGQNSNTLVQDSVFNLTNEQVSWDMAFTFKTQNYWRGLAVSNSPTLSTQAGVIWKNWILGMYGGVGFDGKYQETDFILVFKRPWFNLHLEYYYNFTSGITDIPEATGLFDFNSKTTRGLLDFIVNVTLDKKKHWLLSSSTLLFGRDTNFGQEKVGTVRTDQRYSQYFSLTYTKDWDTSKVQAHIGVAFSWTNLSSANFYGSRTGVNDIGIAYTKTILLNENLSLPVKASAYINPLDQSTFLILTINLIQLSKHM